MFARTADFAVGQLEERGKRAAERAARRARRETEENGEGAPWKEQETWEGEQIKKASMRVGAQDRAAAAAAYDFVIDDQIEFIKDQALAGDLVRLRSAVPYPAPFPYPHGGRPQSARQHVPVPALGLLGAAPREATWAAGPGGCKLRGMCPRCPANGGAPRARAGPGRERGGSGGARARGRRGGRQVRL